MMIYSRATCVSRHIRKYRVRCADCRWALCVRFLRGGLRTRPVTTTAILDRECTETAAAGVKGREAGPRAPWPLMLRPACVMRSWLCGAWRRWTRHWAWCSGTVWCPSWRTGSRSVSTDSAKLTSSAVAARQTPTAPRHDVPTGSRRSSGSSLPSRRASWTGPILLFRPESVSCWEAVVHGARPAWLRDLLSRRSQSPLLTAWLVTPATATRTAWWGWRSRDARYCCHRSGFTIQPSGPGRRRVLPTRLTVIPARPHMTRMLLRGMTRMQRRLQRLAAAPLMNSCVMSWVNHWQRPIEAAVKLRRLRANQMWVVLFWSSWPYKIISVCILNISL